MNVPFVATLWGLLASAIVVHQAASRKLKSIDARKTAAEHQLAGARSAAEKQEAQMPFAASATLTTCARCGAPIHLVARPEVACSHCGASVPVPRELCELAAARDRRASATQEAASSLMRALRLTHPAVSVLYVVLAAAVGIGVYAIVQRATTAPFGTALFGTQLLWVPLFLVPFGLAAASASQVGQHAELRRIRTDFAPAPGFQGKGWACRNCGAPLAATESGVGEPCAFCGAENVIPKLVQRTAEASRRQARALAQTVGYARAASSRAVWRVVCLPAVAVMRVAIPLTGLVAIIGLVLALIVR
jgi:hypothetical protein